VGRVGPASARPGDGRREGAVIPLDVHSGDSSRECERQPARNRPIS
jgi:hypothetical protein